MLIVKFKMEPGWVGTVVTTLHTLMALIDKLYP